MITSAFKIKSQTMFFFSNNIDKLPTLHRLYLHFTCSIIRFAKVPERTWWRYIRRCMRRRCLLLINSSKMYVVCGSLSILFTCFTIVRPTRTWPGSYAWISDWQELHVFFLYRLTYENCGGSKPFDEVSMWTFFFGFGLFPPVWCPATLSITGTTPQQHPLPEPRRPRYKRTRLL